MKRGHVVRLGKHRLMCGDAGDPADVAKLFGGALPDLVFTSPPYASQRRYTHDIPCWDTLMQRVFTAMPWHEKTQALVNLGLIHRNCEWVPYWEAWIQWMREHGWRRFGLYVFDKTCALPGDFNGRLAPSFEFIFHFNKKCVKPNKTEPCKYFGKDHFRGTTSQGNSAWCGRKVAPKAAIQPFKIRRDVVSAVCRDRTGHPAAFPLAFPLAIHASYSSPGQSVYDPFVGSGTSLIAADQGGRIGYGMEISEEYCDIAVERFRKHQEKDKASTRQGKLL